MKWPDWAAPKSVTLEEPPKVEEAPGSTVRPSDYCLVPSLPVKVAPETPAITPVLLPHAPLRVDQAPRVKVEVHKPAELDFPKLSGVGHVCGCGTIRQDN